MVVSDPISLPGKEQGIFRFPPRKVSLQENVIILFLQHNTEMNIKEIN